MKKTRTGIILLIMIFVILTVVPLTASAVPRFSKRTVSIKKKKSVKLSLKSLSKKQKKKKWGFSSSDRTVATVKRASKTSCIIEAKKDGYVMIRARQGKTVAYVPVKVGKGSKRTAGKTKVWAKKAANIDAGTDGSLLDLTIEPDHLNMLVSLDGEEDEYYEELTLRYGTKKIPPQNAIWNSDNPNIAEVDKYGWVTSMGVGKTTITAWYNGEFAHCTVAVTRKITSDTLGE